jgi:hypothetical protein
MEGPRKSTKKKTVSTVNLRIDIWPLEYEPGVLTTRPRPSVGNVELWLHQQAACTLRLFGKPHVYTNSLLHTQAEMLRRKEYHGRIFTVSEVNAKI